MLPSVHNIKGRRSGFTLIELLVVIAIIAILASILFPVFARARENARRTSCQSNMKQIGLGIIQYNQDYDEKYPLQESDGGIATGINNNGSAFPQSWDLVIQPYVKSMQLLVCPSDTRSQVYNGGIPGRLGTPLRRSYAIAKYLTERRNNDPGDVSTGIGLSLAAINQPSLTVLSGERRGCGNGNANGAEWWLCAEIPVTDQVASTTAFGMNDAAATEGVHLGTVNWLYTDGHVKSLRIQRNNGATSMQPLTGHPSNFGPGSWIQNGNDLPK